MKVPCFAAAKYMTIWQILCQVNGTNHNHITVPAPSNNTQQVPAPLTPTPGSIVTNSLVTKQNNVVKKFQIVENPSYEHEHNNINESGEETVEAETSETESKFSSDEEDEDDESSSTPPEDYVEYVEVSYFKHKIKRRNIFTLYPYFVTCNEKQIT